MSAVLALVAATAMAVPAPSGLDAYKPLLGEWVGTSNGQFGRATVSRKYEKVAAGTAIRYETVARFVDAAGKATNTHRDFGYITFDRSSKKSLIREFIEEGAVLTYVQESDSPFQFKSKEIENNPVPHSVARTAWRLDGKDSFVEVFEIAMPGKPFGEMQRIAFRKKR